MTRASGRPASRCPAPTRTPGGVLRCVVAASHCDEPTHRRFDRFAPLLEVVWRIKPWWPNRLGRAQDFGRAHTPYVHPCKHCEPAGNLGPRRGRHGTPRRPR